MNKAYTMREVWDIIEGWLAANTPWIRDSLAPPATENEIRAAEAALGFTLPADIRESYQIHNGQKPFRPFIDKHRTGFVYGDQLQTLEWITEGWQRDPVAAGEPRLSEVIGPVRREPGNLRWVPLTIGPDNSIYYLDMDPAPGGNVGQIIMYIYDEIKAIRVNRSWHERLLYLAVRLSLGMYVYSESMGLVTVKDRADDMEAKGIKTSEEEAEYRRLREIQQRTTRQKPELP